MFNKMLVKVCIIDFYSGYGPGAQKFVGQVLVLKLMSPEFNIFIADLISNRGHATFQHFNISIF